MSPRAACRLERYGYDVYDYTLGLVDWIASGLPTEGSLPRDDRVLVAMDRSPATVQVGASVGDAREFGVASVLVLDGFTVVGRVRRNAWEAADSESVEHVMESGPTTVRAHEPLAALLARMAERGTPEVVVTTPEGHLLGVVRP